MDERVRIDMNLVPLVAIIAVQTKPTDHVDQNIEGWTVRVDTRLQQTENKELGERAIKWLANRLFIITRFVPAEPLAKLRMVTIVLDLTNGDLISPQYHPGREWLVQHGYDPQLVKCVHLPNAKYFAGEIFQFSQPLAVLHELAHSYHDQVLGFNNAEITAAYNAFKDSKKYEKVLRWGGKMDRHYALTNPQEFFAEMTESYFGANDFYPFNHGELKVAEPQIEALMRKIWGPTPAG